MKKAASVTGVLMVCLILWYFRGIVLYIALAAVVSLLGRPLMSLLGKIRIGRFSCPTWLCAIFTLLIIIAVLGGVVMLLIPLFHQVSSSFSGWERTFSSGALAGYFDRVNYWLVSTFPAALGEDFNVQKELLAYVREMIGAGGNVPDMVTGAFSTLGNMLIAVFSVVFISFFFLSNYNLLTRTIINLAPEKFSEQIQRTSDSISELLSRYFIGITFESLCITLLNSLGFIFILKMNPSMAILLALITGILNIIPYAGPFIGHVLALLISLLTYRSGGFSIGACLALTFAITMTTQLVDNFLFQPLIYSSSVKAHPLEIFLIILMAGTVAGVLGVFVAIPVYTMLRVVAGEFLSGFRFFDRISKSLRD
ncbi:MAG: AI-2E family transporter [Bacteroidales bacterium]|nr:AI-2E family transporter [Bacteroidales bacterium]